ncbi:MAG: hypothetical protein NVS4B11_09380 [Ktedonobacteraceae bacterium]
MLYILVTKYKVQSDSLKDSKRAILTKLVKQSSTREALTNVPLKKFEGITTPQHDGVSISEV